MHVHIQAAATLMLAPHDSLEKNLAALLRVLCGFKAGSVHKWALKIQVHPFDTGEQRTLRKVNKAGLYGYCLKQRFTSAVFRCALCNPSECCRRCAIAGQLLQEFHLLYAFLLHAQ